eukprot:TRINITY_DN263_c0_g1_i5.p1 TRINITY_DN263_c0_g1~~TRINITY_DN263_c0_g1_i5.p1  ORF type:complete len:375 (-),score=84.24 TRINITY_DN263_c0_g1_i5:3-1127(-)
MCIRDRVSTQSTWGYKKKQHCVVLKSNLDKEYKYPPEVYFVVDIIIFSRFDLIDIMKNVGFQTVETIYPLLKTYKEELAALKERKEFKEGNMEILCYLDANEKTDMMLGCSGMKFMEENGMEYAGSSYEFAIDTINKSGMKSLLLERGVPTAPFVYLEKWDEEKVRKANLTYPVLIKLTDSCASVGMTKDSKCFSIEELEKVVKKKFELYSEHPVIVENFITGREFTALVVGNYDQEVKVYPPTERVFDSSISEGDRWLHYDFYWKSAVPKLFFKKVTDEKVAKEVSEIAKKTFIALKGCCYGRVDIRQDQATGKYYVLEINATPNLGYESTTNYLLNEAGYQTEDLIEEIFYYAKRHYQKKQPFTQHLSLIHI